MGAYLSGFNYADKVRPLADSIALSKIMAEQIEPKFLRSALAVLVKTRGIDSTATIVYNKMRFDYKHYLQGWIRMKGSWQDDVCSVEESMSPVLLKTLKKIVVEKNDDPVWMSKYLSEEKMFELCMEGKFKNAELIAYSSNLDSIKRIAIFEKYTDEDIVKYGLGNRISHNRMIEIAKKMKFEGAYNFLVESRASLKEKRELIIQNVRQLNGYALLWFYATGNLSDGEMKNLLKQKSTKQLAGNFPEKTTVEIWSFPYKIYGMEVIRSVKERDDYYTASKFFEQTADGSRKTLWLNMLKNSKGYLIL